MKLQWIIAGTVAAVCASTAALCIVAVRVDETNVNERAWRDLMAERQARAERMKSSRWD